MSDTSAVSAELDVLTKYNSLVKQSLGGDSVYIRAKETVKDLVSSGDLDSAQQAEVIGNIIGGLVNGITSSAMSSAIAWAQQEKEFALKKLELDQQLLILEQEKLLKTAQVSQVDIQSRASLVETKRMYGTGTFDGNGTLISLAEEGKVWNDMQLVEQQTTNAGIEETLLETKVKESAAAVHKVVADTFTNFGAFTFAYDPSGNGFSSITRVDSNNSLSDTQQQIAIEQGKGYTYNAWANALTGSASMLGTAIASDLVDFAEGSTGANLLETVLECATNLKNADTTDDEAIPGQ